MSLGVYRQIAYAGLVLWGVVLAEFVLWKIFRRYVLKKPVPIPTLMGEADKAAFLARKQTSLKKSIKWLNRFSWGLGFSIMFSSLGILVSGVLGTVVSKSFILRSLLLTSMLIPAYFGNQSVASILQDSLRQLENEERKFES